MLPKRFPFANRLLASLSLAFFLALSGCATGPSEGGDEKLYMGFQTGVLTPGLAMDLGASETTRGLPVLGFYNLVPSKTKAPGAKDLIPSPAKAAGMREGDIIVKLKNDDDELVDVVDWKSYQEVYDDLSEEKPVEIEILREGKIVSLAVNRSPSSGAVVLQPGPRPEPRTLKVSSNGAGDYRSLDGALFFSRPGDTILLSPGDYNESYYGSDDQVNPGIVLFRSNLTLASENPQNKAKIKGAILLSGTGVKLQNLDVEGTLGNSGISLANSEQVLVENCSVRGAKPASPPKTSNSSPSRTTWSPGTPRVCRCAGAISPSREI